MTPDPLLKIDKFPIVLQLRSSHDSGLWSRLDPVFRKYCCQVKTIIGRTDAVGLTKTANPDIIVLDWNEEAERSIRAVKGDPECFRTPVLVVCGEPKPDDVAAMIRSGADDCIQTATPDALLEARVLSVLKMKRLMDRVVTLMKEQSCRDSLTGLWNHGHFFRLLKTELNRAARSGSNLSVLMLDLDHFKNLNDRFGHTAGDQALSEVVRLMRSSVRDSDVIARYGGEEFAVILPETDRRGAFQLADRIRASLSDNRIKLGMSPIRVTVSTGISVFPDDALELEELVNAADMALYQAKRMGRNRIESVKKVSLEFVADHDLSAVGVAGDFNAWLPEHDLLVEQGRERHWKKDLILPTGRIRYKFMTLSAAGSGKNPEWVLDPRNSESEIDGMGQVNSILTIDEYPFASSGNDSTH